MQTTRRNILRQGAGVVTGIALTGCNVPDVAHAQADPATTAEKY